MFILLLCNCLAKTCKWLWLHYLMWWTSFSVIHLQAFQIYKYFGFIQQLRLMSCFTSARLLFFSRTKAIISFQKHAGNTDYFMEQENTIILQINRTLSFSENSQHLHILRILFNGTSYIIVTYLYYTAPLAHLVQHLI